jgi:hypothetical protein
MDGNLAILCSNIEGADEEADGLGKAGARNSDPAVSFSR